MPDAIKLCKDCKYFSPDLVGPICAHPQAAVIDYVNGNDYQKACDAMRIHTCGPEGKLWEAAT